MKHDIGFPDNQFRRSSWIEAGKALGIVLVVVCHNPYIPSFQRDFYNLVMSFHVPLFFALSGATMSRYDSWRKCAVRSLSLMWVYFLTATVALPLVALRPDAAHAELTPLLLGILYGTGHTMHPGPLWFLPCLALCIPISWLVLRTSQLPQLSKVTVSILPAALGICFAIANAYVLSSFPRTMVDSLNWGTFEHSGAFWSSDLVFLGSGFMLFGWSLNKALSKTPSILTVLGTLFVFAALFYIYSPSTNMDSRLVQPPVGAVFVAATGIAAAFLTLRLANNCPAWILAIGAATLPILVMHQFIQKKIIIIINGSLSNVTFLSFALSVILAIGLSTLLDQFVFRKIFVGRLIFYPRTLFAKLR